MATKKEQQQASALKNAAKKVDDAIRNGTLDQGVMIGLWRHINEALIAGSVGTRWRLTDAALRIDFTEDDLTLGDAAIIKARTGLTTGECDPLSDATVYAAIAYAWLVNHEGRDSADADALVNDIPINVAADNIKVEVVAPDPKGLPAGA